MGDKMTNIKTSILLASATLVAAATTTGVATALYGTDPQTIIRLTTVASILGVGSIGLFFVGLVFPATAKVRK